MSDESTQFTSAMDDLKDLERERGELLEQPRTTLRDDRLDFLSRSQRRIVELMAKVHRKD